MQSLSGKLAALNRVLSRSAKRALPFFETLKNITKENKEDYRWTKEAEHAFQELKKLILEFPTLTTLEQKETLFVYLATSCDAVSGVLVADRKGKQTSIRYVSQTLHEAERNYGRLEKLALCLLHLSRRLRRYFEAHPIKVITNQPVKQILNKPEASGKLAKYVVELEAYNITYIPRTAVKGQILADFINEVPVGTRHVEVCSLAGEGDPEGWTLYTDGASSLKGVEAGLFLIDLFGTKYTYAIRLTFPSTNNEAEYEELLARLSEFVASNEGMEKYLAKAKEQAALFKKFSIKNIPRNQNHKADVLSKLTSVTFNHLTKEILVNVLNAKSVDDQEVSTIVEEKEDNWMTPIIKELEFGVLQFSKGSLEKEKLLLPKLPKTRLTSIMSSWPFCQWGLDIMGPLPEGPGKLKFIIVAIDYFTKWIEAKPLAKTTSKELVNDPFKSWCEKWKIEQMNIAVAHTQANGLVERANKSLMHGLKARLGREIVGWVDKLPNILWAHRTMLNTRNGETPFSLTYGSEAVIPAEIGMPTYQTIHFNETQNEEEMRLNLDLSQERRETTAIREAKYKRRWSSTTTKGFVNSKSVISYTGRTQPVESKTMESCVRTRKDHTG
ncbi:reverse transcriptase domain-containing protein [Tanacetum coccineum]